jgi:hypothetical protein
MRAESTIMLQRDKTTFYEGLQNRELEYRQKLIDNMTWLRPFDRLRRAKIVAQVDRLLARVGVTLEESRLADALPEPLQYDAAAEHPVAVVDDGRLAGGDGANRLVELDTCPITTDVKSATD